MKHLLFLLLIQALCLTAGDKPLTRDIELVGHRGARGLLPEHTPPGFLLCYDSGVSAIKVNLVLTRDDRFILHHQTSLDPRLCIDATRKRPPETPIRQLDSHVLQDINCGALRHPAFPRQQVLQRAKMLTLGRFFQWVLQAEQRYKERAQPMRFILEVKIPKDADEAEIAHTAKVLKTQLTGLAFLPRITLQSFSLPFLTQIKKELPDVPRSAIFTPGYLAAKTAETRTAEMLKVGKELKLKNIAPIYKIVNADLVKQAHAAGLQVFTWNVNVGRQMDDMRAKGVDGIISDYPTRLYAAQQRWKKANPKK